MTRAPNLHRRTSRRTSSGPFSHSSSATPIKLPPAIHPDATGNAKFCETCGCFFSSHVRRERMVCKFWLSPAALAANYDFSARELNVIRSYIEKYRPRLLEAWDEHCGA